MGSVEWGKVRKVTKAATGGVLRKKAFLKILQNLQENACPRVGFLIKLQTSACNFISKMTLTQVFCCDFSDVPKNSFLHRTPPMAAF